MIYLLLIHYLNLYIGQNLNSKNDSKFSEYEFIGNFILNKYNKSNKEQKRINI